MQVSPVDRSIALTVKADGTGAAASSPANGTGTAASAAPAAEALRAGVTQPPVDKTDYLGSKQGAAGPDNTPSAGLDGNQSDWATTEKALAEKKAREKEEVRPRLYEMLIEQFNSLWRASTQAVDPATQSQALAQATRQSQQDSSGKSQPLVYTDPSKVRKASSAEGA